MEKTAILTPCDDIEMKKHYRESLIVNVSPFLRNACDIAFVSTENDELLRDGKININVVFDMMNQSKNSCAYLIEDSSIPVGEVHYKHTSNLKRNSKYMKEIKEKKKGIAYVNSLSTVTDGMMKALSKEANILIVPYQSLNNKNFHDRVSFACWTYFIRTWIVVPKDMTNKEKRKLYNGLAKHRYNLKPQFDITPNSEDIKREFKIRCKEIHSEIFGISLVGIAWIVTAAFGVAGLVIEGFIFTTDATITGIRYGVLKAKERKRNSWAKLKACTDNYRKIETRVF